VEALAGGLRRLALTQLVGGAPGGADAAAAAARAAAARPRTMGDGSPARGNERGCFPRASPTSAASKLTPRGAPSPAVRLEF